MSVINDMSGIHYALLLHLFAMLFAQLVPWLNAIALEIAEGVGLKMCLVRPHPSLRLPEVRITVPGTSPSPTMTNSSERVRGETMRP